MISLVSILRSRFYVKRVEVCESIDLVFEACTYSRDNIFHVNLAVVVAVAEEDLLLKLDDRVSAGTAGKKNQPFSSAKSLYMGGGKNFDRLVKRNELTFILAGLVVQNVFVNEGGCCPCQHKPCGVCPYPEQPLLLRIWNIRGGYPLRPPRVLYRS